VASAGESDRIPLNLDRIARLRELLSAARRLTDGYTEADPTWAGMPGSKAAAEATDPATSPALLYELNGAYAFAQVRVEAVLEYGESIALLCSESNGPSGSLGIDVLTRSAVETASRALWALEDGLSAERRAARYLAIEVHSAHHLDRLAEAMKLNPREPMVVPTQMDAVKMRCNTAGLRVTMENKERPRVGSERLPSPTGLVLALVKDAQFAHEGKGIYELGSAVAHGASYALLRSYGIATGEQPSDRRAVFRLPVDHRIVEAAIAMLLFAYIALMKRLVELTGWDQAQFARFDEQVQSFLNDGPLVIS
jgi:hypothetical protein